MFAPVRLALTNGSGGTASTDQGRGPLHQSGLSRKGRRCPWIGNQHTQDTQGWWPLLDSPSVRQGSRGQTHLRQSHRQSRQDPLHASQKKSWVRRSSGTSWGGHQRTSPVAINSKIEWTMPYAESDHE